MKRSMTKVLIAFILFFCVTPQVGCVVVKLGEVKPGVGRTQRVYFYAGTSPNELPAWVYKPEKKETKDVGLVSLRTSWVDTILVNVMTLGTGGILLAPELIPNMLNPERVTMVYDKRLGRGEGSHYHTGSHTNHSTTVTVPSGY